MLSVKIPVKAVSHDTTNRKSFVAIPAVCFFDVVVLLYKIVC